MLRHLHYARKDPELRGRMKRWNHGWGKQRICVEWGLKDLKDMLFPGVLLMQVLSSSPALAWIWAVIMTNLHNCLSPHQTSQHFGVHPGTPEEYLSDYMAIDCQCPFCRAQHDD
jgi:hypothetical protein